jgi:hypothetical protein
MNIMRLCHSLGGCMLIVEIDLFGVWSWQIGWRCRSSSFRPATMPWRGNCGTPCNDWRPCSPTSSPSRMAPTVRPGPEPMSVCCASCAKPNCVSRPTSPASVLLGKRFWPLRKTIGVRGCGRWWRCAATCRVSLRQVSPRQRWIPRASLRPLLARPQWIAGALLLRVSPRPQRIPRASIRRVSRGLPRFCRVNRTAFAMRPTWSQG